MNHPYKNFQLCVRAWCIETFGQTVSDNLPERTYRFLEEALELCQSLGCSKAHALRLVDYVYGRPVGDPPQEVGGTMVTLAALCAAAGISMEQAAWTEQRRCEQPEVRAKIQAKQAAKRSMTDPEPGQL